MEFSYAVLTNFRRTPLRERAEAGDKTARRILSLSDDLPHLYITTQLVLMLVRFAIVAVATINLAEPIIYAQQSGFFIEPGIGYLAVLLPLALLTYIVGDLAPSAFGVAYADQAAALVTSIMRPIVLIFSPLVSLMMRLSRTISRISGGEDLKKAVTEEEIMSLVDVGQQGGAIEDEEKEMIYSVLQFGETLAREVMVPRPDVVAVEIDQTLDEALAKFIASGHSRLPVYEEEIDDIKGLLYAKDLLNLWHSDGKKQATIRALMRPAYFVPETKRADMLFKEMQDRKIHLAIIVDEYGGTAGIVTIEDLIEEIVGDIRDEYDINEEAEYVELSANEYIVDGSMNLDDLNEMLSTDLPTEEADSIGGYIYSKLGHVPEIGEIIEEPEHHVRMRIEAVENRRIRKVHIMHIEPPAQDDTAEAEAPRDTDKRRVTETHKRVTDSIESETQPKPAQSG
jgi:CBS domain containing-hemolysin-like protein